MRIVLVHMPWAPIDIPSLALGILRTAAQRLGHEVHVRFANLDLVDWLTKRTDFDLRGYHFYSESSYFQGAGDWVFSSALYQPEPGRVERFARLLDRENASAAEIAMSAELYQLAPEFIEHLVADLDDLAPDLVGFTTTFQQNTASLAAARALKRRRPGIRTVFGGANCDGPQGAALHRNFPFVDYVVRGEGEEAFPALLAALAVAADAPAATDRAPAVADLTAIAGLCWRVADGASVVNPMARRPLPPGDILPPTFDGFFDRLDASAASGWVEPRLVVEGARGCWWGEKHHCTFCGLNGSFMQFRSKSPERFYAELVELAERHRLLDFFVVDNILDMRYFDSVLARLVESGHDVRMQYEVKSNLRRDHFQRLADSGAVYVQPGIESLNSHVLRLMDKGVSGCQNIRALRDAESTGVTATWNYLYGFPGETRQDYQDIIEQLPRLHHLAPPVGVSRIAIERFSPYFNRPELGFAELRPAPQYAEIYQLPETELTDLAYLFSAPPRGIDEALAGTLGAGLDEWRDAYPDSRLAYHDLADRIVLISQRAGYDWRTLELTAELEIALFRLLDQPRSVSVLTDRTAPLGADPAAVETILRRWSQLGVVFTDAGSWIHLATEARNQMLLRVQHRHRPVQHRPDQPTVRALAATRRERPAPAPTSGAGGAGVPVQLWRDHDPALRDQPGMRLGRHRVTGDWARWAAEWDRAGARGLRLDRPVVLCADGGPDDAGALALIRELTSRAIAVDWEARCHAGCDDAGLFSHLWPPSQLYHGESPSQVHCGEGPDEVGRGWRERYFPAKCVFRQGPGFLEVRDRRFGSLELFTIDDPEWIDAVGAMAEGAPPATVPADARTAFAEARLTVERAGSIWWLPARIRRWPFPPLLV